MRRAAAVVCLALWGSCGPALAAELHLTISNVIPGAGQIMIQVLDSAAALDDQASPVAAFVLPATAERLRLSTSALQPGTYGIRVMHDRNGNGRMDNNILGIPREPWGFSNNASGSFGPPSWEAVSFRMQGTVTQEIRLNR